MHHPDDGRYQDQEEEEDEGEGRRSLKEALESVMGTEVFSVDDAVDMAESTDFDVIFAKGEIMGLVYEGKPFLTIRGLLSTGRPRDS